jgi:hypothetical protein
MMTEKAVKCNQKRDGQPAAKWVHTHKIKQV